MIDLILYGTTRATILDFAVARGLASTDGQGSYNVRTGIDYFWWAGDGKFRTGPSSYLAGFAMLIRINDPSDTISNPVDGEQWSRSKIAQYIKNNGTPGTMGSIPYYEVSNVRLFRASDVFSWLASQGIPANEWFGGNSI
jgi:hypothetical protein